MRVFAVYFWHSEGWTPRNEALMVVKQGRTTRHPWQVACQSNMDSGDVQTSLWVKENVCLLNRQKRELLGADPQAQKAS